MLVHNGNIDDARHKYGVFNEEVLHGLDLVDLWIGQLMRALEDSGHLHDTDVIIVSDHGQMDLSRVIKPNVFFADAGLIQVDENGNLRDWTAFCCSNAMSAMVYLKDPANVQDYAKTYAVLQKMAAEGIYGFTTVYTKDETKAMGLDGDFRLYWKRMGIPPSVQIGTVLRYAPLTETISGTGMPHTDICRKKDPSLPSWQSAPPSGKMYGSTVPL